MINRVCLTGRLTKDVELMRTQSGNVICNITLAVDRNFKKEGQQNADFINCVAFNKQAEAMNKYLSKGSLIGIDGRIQTGSYKNKDGYNINTMDVIVDHFTFLESRKTNQTKEELTAEPIYDYPKEAIIDVNEDLPF